MTAAMMNLIGDAVRHYNDLLFEHHLEDTREHLTRAIARDPLIAECRVLRPHFVDAIAYDRTLEVTALLNEALVVAANRLLEDRQLRQTIGIPDYFDDILALDRAHGRPSVMARFDGLFDATGDFKAIEYNAQPEFSPARAIDDTFASSRIAAAFANDYRYRTIRLDDYAIDALRADHGAGNPPSTIGVPAGSDIGRHWLRRAQTVGHRVSFAPYEKYRFDKGRLIVDDLGETVVDVVVLHWEDVLCPMDEMQPVLQAISAGAVRVLEGLSRGLLCGYKHTLEILSDPQYAGMFDARVAAVLPRHVPWTRSVREHKTTYGDQPVDLVSFIATHRERLVLKPSGGSQGQGVVLGRQCDDQTWSQTLKRALKQKYIVQEWVQGQVGTYPTLAGSSATLLEATSDLNPFVWSATQVAGCQVRLSTSGKHSADDGASVAAVWVIEARH